MRRAFCSAFLCVSTAALAAVACSSSGGGGASGDGGAGGSSGGGGSSGSSGGASSSGSGGTQPTVLASGQTQAGGIASNGTVVVWTMHGGTNPSYYQGTGSVMSVAPSGGTPKALASNTDLGGQVFLDSTYVYWYGSTAIDKVALAGGSIMPILQNLSDTPYEMAMNATNLYWENTTQIHTVPVAGGKNTELAALADAGLQSNYGQQLIGASSAGIFVSAEQGIASVPLTGGGATSVVTNANVTVLVVDSTSVYYGVAGTSAAIMKAPVGGGAPTTLATLTVTEVPAYMALDGDTLYWVEGGEGSVKKVATSGGTPVTLAGAPKLPGGIAVDSKYVYWTDPTGGNVYQLPK